MGLDSAVPAEGRYDLLTVLTHEIGHAIGFGEAFAGFANSVGEGSSVFVTSLDDSVALDETGEHLDPAVYPNDLMVAFISPGIRRTISTVDIEVIESAYAAASPGDVVLTQNHAHLIGIEPLDDELVDAAFSELLPID